MEYLKLVLYGLIQGLTEFIPVSSTAHLKVISLFLGIDDPGASLSATIQLGSVLAIACILGMIFIIPEVNLPKNFLNISYMKDY